MSLNETLNDLDGGRTQTVHHLQEMTQDEITHLPHTTVPDGTFIVGFSKQNKIPHIISVILSVPRVTF